MGNMVEFKSTISCKFGQGKGVVASVKCYKNIHNSVPYYIDIHGFAIISKFTFSKKILS